MDAKQYILDERKKGTPDEQIYASLKASNFGSTAMSAPRSTQRGFTGEVIPTGGAIAGGIVGSALGPIGGIIGAGIGGALGETGQQTIEKDIGSRESYDPAQIAATGASSMLLEGGAKVAGKVAGAALNKVRQPLVSVVSKLSGTADNILEKLMSRTPGAVAGVKEGEQALDNVIEKAAQKFHDFAKNSVTEWNKKLAELSKTESLGGPSQSASRNLLLAEGRDFVSSISKKLRQANISVSKNGALNFARSQAPSNIVSGSQQQTVQEAYMWVKSLQEDVSVKHIDAVLNRLITYARNTPANSPTGPEAKALVNTMINDVLKFTDDVYPKVASEMRKNHETRYFISEMKQIFGTKPNPTPKEVSQMATKLMQIYNTGRLPIKGATEELGQKIGEDISGTVAGTLFKTAGQVSQRAKNLTKRGAVEKVLEAVPRKVVDNWVRTGKMTGDWASMPTVKMIMKTTGLTAKALLLELTNLSQDKTSD